MEARLRFAQNVKAPPPDRGCGAPRGREGRYKKFHPNPFLRPLLLLSSQKPGRLLAPDFETKTEALQDFDVNDQPSFILAKEAHHGTNCF
jgi:hypothetical protein